MKAIRPESEIERANRIHRLRHDSQAAQGISTAKMLSFVIGVFVLIIVAAAFTPVLQTQVIAWRAALNSSGNTAASTVVSLVPLLIWLLLAVGIILAAVAVFMPGKGGL